jgi:hypothetical protein
MLDFDVSPRILQIFGYEPAVAVMRTFFTAEQAGAIEQIGRECSFDLSGVD